MRNTNRSLHGAFALFLILMSALVACADEHRISERKFEMEILNADIVPYISETEVSMLLLELTGAKVEATTDSGTEVGEVKATVVEVFHSDDVETGQEIVIPFERVADEQARFSQGFDKWNTLSLAAGDLLIMASAPLDPPERWQGLGVLEVEARDAPEIAAVHRCYKIEATSKEPQKYKVELRTALGDADDLIRYFAIDAVTRRELYDRHDAVAMLSQALGRVQESSVIREDLTTALGDYFFDEEQGVDAINVEVIGAILKATIAESDREAQGELVQTLASLVFSGFADDEKEDEALQIELAQRVQDPPISRVIPVLEAHAAAGEDDEREVAQDLLDIWRAAARR